MGTTSCGWAVSVFWRRVNCSIAFLSLTDGATYGLIRIGAVCYGFQWGDTSTAGFQIAWKCPFIASDTSIKREKQKLRELYLEIPQNDKGIDGQSEFRL